MVYFDNHQLLLFKAIFIFLLTIASGAEIFYEWHVAVDTTIKPVSEDQPVITINGLFPGPLINASTNDNVHINVFNEMDEPVLFTWNGIQQRLNSWQDGVSGTNCPIQPGRNWTYGFQFKDQIGSFFYFPSINFHKAGGGFGPIRVNNRAVISVPFPKPEAEFELLIGDWYEKSYKDVRSMLKNSSAAHHYLPDWMLINGKIPYSNNSTNAHESFTVQQGKTYRFRISNVGTTWSFNLRIQDHQMLLVETEGSYTSQIQLNSLDVHVGQSYSVLVTADQEAADYYIVASPKMVNVNDSSNLVGVGVLHYDNSTKNASGPIPSGPDPFDLEFSINQARSIKWNMTTGAARPNPQGTFNVTNVTLSQTFILNGSTAHIDGTLYYTVNNVSYLNPDTPLKLADALGVNGSGVFELDEFSANGTNGDAKHGVFVATGTHKGWIEIVLQNDLDVMNSWHLDGFSFYVVGFGEGQWRNESRNTYNIDDPVVRSTIQVYPKRWSAVYAYLDNPGMWNLRSQNLKNWYLGQELYLRVYDPDPNPAKERLPPSNLLLCGIFSNLVLQPPPPPMVPTPDAPDPPSPPPPVVPTPDAPGPPSPSIASSGTISWFHSIMTCYVLIFYISQQ